MKLEQYGLTNEGRPDAGHCSHRKFSEAGRDQEKQPAWPGYLPIKPRYQNAFRGMAQLQCAWKRSEFIRSIHAGII